MSSLQFGMESDPVQAGESFQLSGILERVTFHNPENGFTIARISVEGEHELVTVVGNLANPVVGEFMEFDGRWKIHREHGRQFQFVKSATTRPATVQAIEKYLGSGLIKGIGPVMAKRMVALFGTQTLDVIEQTPAKLKQVEGIGDRRVESIRQAWQEQREIRRVMLYLQDAGVSPAFAVRIYKTYGDSAIALIEDNPYRLAEDIRGIGFRTADTIAQRLGIDPESPRRLQAGLVYTLSEATNHGHLYLPENKLFNSAAKILEVDRSLLPTGLAELIASEQVIVEELPSDPLRSVPDRIIYHPALYYTELGLARQIRRRLDLPAPPGVSREKLQSWLEKRNDQPGVTLSKEQLEAVAVALENRIFILTGGPGTGKTTVTNTIAAAFEARGKRLLLASPTGRAAKRLSEVTGREAATIHRILLFDPAAHRFVYDEEHTLDCDVLIVDEVSMLDASLAHNLLKAVPETAQVVMVGDSDQLPSVGPGNVLADLLASGEVPSCTLTQIYRQAQESLIVTNAHRIRQGLLPDLVPPAERGEKNCLWIEADDILRDATPEEAEAIIERDGPDPEGLTPQVLMKSGSEIGADRIVRLVQKTLPALGYSLEDVGVLTPMHRGNLGAALLNERLQQALNPPDRSGKTPEMVQGSRCFRIGDRVIQLVNNYDRKVFNGDVGTIAAIDLQNRLFRVRYPEGMVEYDFADSDELQLAYALTIHKSQGSEYPAVVLAIHISHFHLLQRNLFYTGLTRARRLCIIVGDTRAIRYAVRNGKAAQRYSRLAERLSNADLRGESEKMSRSQKGVPWV